MFTLAEPEILLGPRERPFALAKDYERFESSRRAQIFILRSGSSPSRVGA
jgi:hypothetical protein